MSQLITYTVEHYRKEGVTPEAFEKFFQEVHLATTLPMMKKYGFVKYSVVRTASDVSRVRWRLTIRVHSNDEIQSYVRPSSPCCRRSIRLGTLARLMS